MYNIYMIHFLSGGW